MACAKGSAEKEKCICRAPKNLRTQTNLGNTLIEKKDLDLGPKLQI